MSNAINELRHIAIAYTGDVIDVTAVREHLRYLRKKHFRSSRKAAAVADLGSSTIAKIENLKSWPKYDPGIGVILQLLGAMDVSLTDFVTDLRDIDQAVVERSRNEVLKVTGIPEEDQPPPTRKVSQDDDPLSPLTREEIQTIRALTKVIKINADREAESERGSHRRHVANPSDEEATPDHRPRSHRERDARKRKRRLTRRIGSKR